MTAPSSPICARCGESVTPGARFCMKCGSDVSGEQSGAATALMPATQEPDANAVILENLRASTIGDYEILRELGRGGMATVYLAHDIALDRKVAIKVMSPALLLMGEGMTERFKREARTAANLSHPHIIPIYTVKSSGKSLFFVMKFISGRSLEAIIKEIGPMPIPMIKAILQQVGHALGYAHRHGIVHRDVKPANIMIDEEGWPVVTDFGIAKVTENRGLTMTGVAVGTPSYMSPEQCAAKDITGKSDQYSLGVVAYEMLTGKQPFEGDSAMAIMFAHFHEQPKPVTGARPDAPADLTDAVMRMLEKSPDKRFATMEEAVGAMGAQPLAHDDPIRKRLIEIAKKGSTSEILRQVTPPPTSPVPPAKTRAMVEQATTPIPTPKVITVAVVPGRSDLHVGDTMQLTATPRASGGTAAPGRVLWQSSDQTVASVSATGLVTALAPGSAAITANCDGISGSAQVTVSSVPVASVTVEPNEPTLASGEELQFRVILRDAHGATLSDREVTWASSPAGIVTLNAQGTALGTREGKVEVIAESEGVKGSTRLTVTPAPVAKVVLAPADCTLKAGETATLEATLTDRKGGKLTGREISWRSAPEKIATVSQRGVVTGVAEGTAEISVTAEGKQATVQVRVTAAPVASVTVVEPRAVVAGERIALQAELKDARGQLVTGRTVKWSSSSPAVATVTADGQLTGMAPGNAKITAESEGKSATVKVTVQQVPVATVLIEGGTEPLAVGARVSLKAVARDAKSNALPGREVTWSSNATKVAGVDANGVVSAKAPGETTVVATIEGKRAEIRVTVAALAPALVPVKADPVADSKTESVPTPALVPPPRKTEQRAEPAPAQEGGKGKLIGAVAGVALLAALGWFFLRPKSDVVPPAPPLPGPVTAQVATVVVSGETGPVAVGRTRQLATEVRDAQGVELSGRQLVWTSSDSTVAVVSPLGAVTGLKPGSVTITAMSEGHSGTLALAVEPPAGPQPSAVASIAVTAEDKALDVGAVVQVYAIVRDAKRQTLADRTVVWTSSDPGVAQVVSVSALDNWPGAGREIADGAAFGRVTGIAAGSVTITANSEGKSGEVRLTVKAPPKPVVPEKPPTPAPVAVASVSVTPEAPSLTAGSTIQLSAAALDDKKKPLADRSASWKSSDERIARVGNDGVVTGVARGTATITATVEGKSSSARVTVNEATVAVAAVQVNAPNRTLKVGETTTWSAVVRDAKGKELSDRTVGWSSSATQVASVNGNGLIAALAPGTAEIRAESEGKSDVVRVTVAALPAPPPPVATTTTNPPPTNPQPTTPSAGTNALLPRRGVEAGGGFSCGIAQNGGAVCWGGAQSGLTGIEGTSGIQRIALGRAHACGLLSGGKAVCWGENRAGQLGDGSTTAATRAVPVSGDLTFSAITTGLAHSCGLVGGKAFCWGKGNDGQLGDASGSDRKKPVAVKSGQSFVAISAGGNHTCALTAAGKAYCWGDGFSGQLGFGGLEKQIEPIDVSGDQKYTRIAAGGNHTCALTGSGKAYCWGANEVGQVGDGSKSDRPSPVAVATGQTFSEISAGSGHTCGLSTGGEVFCWGENKFGQLGDGSKNDRNKPVSAGSGFTSISAGEGHSCGVARGEAVCWGRNEKGQLGDGGTAARTTPTPVQP